MRRRGPVRREHEEWQPLRALAPRRPLLAGFLPAVPASLALQVLPTSSFLPRKVRAQPPQPHLQPRSHKLPSEAVLLCQLQERPMFSTGEQHSRAILRCKWPCMDSVLRRFSGRTLGVACARRLGARHRASGGLQQRLRFESQVQTTSVHRTQSGCGALNLQRLAAALGSQLSLRCPQHHHVL